MPINPTYPGVYVQEIPSGVRTITGVSTSVTAFVGLAKTGETNKATRVSSFADYERLFGGLADYSHMSYAVRQFFLNGGTEAFVVRIAGKNTATAHATLSKGSGQNKKDILQVDALQPGDTGRETEVFIVTGSDSTFKLVVVNFSKPQQGGTTTSKPADVVVESIDDLSMDKDAANYVEKKVKASSQLIRVSDLAKDKTVRLDATEAAHGTLTSDSIADSDVKSLPDTTTNGKATSFRIVLDGSSPQTITPVSPKQGSPFANLGEVATAIQTAVTAARPADPAYQGFTCTVKNGKLVLSSGSYGITSSVKVLAATDDKLAEKLKLLQTSATEGKAQGTALQNASGGAFVVGEEYNLFIRLLSSSNRNRHRR